MHINKQVEKERKQLNKGRLENAKNKPRNMHKMAAGNLTDMPAASRLSTLAQSLSTMSALRPDKANKA